VNLAGRPRSALIVTLNLAVAAIYLVHVGHGIGLGDYRIDLEVYRTGARVLLYGGDLYGQLPRLGDGHELPFTYPPFAALSFVPLAILGYNIANWLLTGVTGACVLLFFLLRRDLRSAARAGLSFAACTGAGFALAPHDSLRYWTKIAYQPARIGGISYTSNQSVLAALARLGLSNPARTWLWLTLCLLVAALTVTGMRGALKAGHVTSALSLNAVAGLLISPISWSHHWVWAAPALLTCLSSNPKRRRMLAFPVLALLIFAIGPHWLLPSGDGRELHWSWWQQAVGGSYALIGFAAVTQAAITALLPRPKRRGPGPAGTLAAPHDHEREPVPSGTRDDASVPARA